MVSKGGDILPLSDRICTLRRQLNLSQAEFGAKVGVKQGSISAWESGAKSPSGAAIVSICQTFGVREEWLRTGEGPMEVQRPKDDVLMNFFNSVLEDQPEAMRRRFVSSLAAFTPEDWETAAALMQKLVKGME